jgi:antitoxin PrlF
MFVLATVRKAKLGAKARLVLPKEVRQALGLKPGDSFAFLIDGEDVRLVRTPIEGDDRFVTFSEWASEADRKGYADL